MLHESKQMCAEYPRHFARLYKEPGSQEVQVSFSFYLSAKDVKFREIPISAENILNSLASYTRKRSLGLVGLHFELYIHLSVFFSELLVDIYHNVATK